jgi:hypothetical protein
VASPQSSITVTHEDERVAYALLEGRYRAAWKTKKDTCPEITISLTPEAGGEPFQKHSLTASFATLFSDVPAGNYFIEQLDPSCTVWSIQVSKID